MECLIGTRDGTIYVYDPLLIAKANVLTYNISGKPYSKEKRPDIVRWVEPIINPTAVKMPEVKDGQVTSSVTRVLNLPKVSKFVVAFEDGCIYIFYKGDKNSVEEDYAKTYIETDKSFKNKDGDHKVTKA